MDFLGIKVDHLGVPKIWYRRVPAWTVCGATSRVVAADGVQHACPRPAPSYVIDVTHGIRHHGTSARPDNTPNNALTTRRHAHGTPPCVRRPRSAAHPLRRDVLRERRGGRRLCGRLAVRRAVRVDRPQGQRLGAAVGKGGQSLRSRPHSPARPASAAASAACPRLR